MRSHVTAVVAALLILSGCATAKLDRPDDIPAPELRIGRGSGPTTTSGNSRLDGALSVLLRAEVVNRSDSDLMLDRIEVRSVGYGALNVPNTTVPLDLKVSARDVAPFERWIATVIQPTISGAGGPVTLQITAYFETSDGRIFREIYTREF